MNAFHMSLPADRHRELLAAGERERLVSAARRQRKATRLQRRATNLLRRASSLVEETSF